MYRMPATIGSVARSLPSWSVWLREIARELRQEARELRRALRRTSGAKWHRLTVRSRVARQTDRKTNRR